ncbi:MAG: glutamine synthetase beta-grasp domain-containing protein [Acidimicrobiales bacterium]
MAYRAEYIWIDGTEPTPLLRSKTKIIKDGVEPGIWGFDGSSTNQAPGDQSDCVLNPVFVCPDPIRGGDDVLVLNEVLTVDMEPHPTNTRAGCAAAEEKYGNQEPWFGIEQEYTFLKDGHPLWLAPGRLPRPAGSVLLRCRRRRDLRP